MPKYLTPYVAVHGWREGYFILFVIAVVAAPLVWLLIRDHPPEAEVKSETGEALPGLTLREAANQSFLEHCRAFVSRNRSARNYSGFIPRQDAGLDATRAGELGAVLRVGNGWQTYHRFFN